MMAMYTGIRFIGYVKEEFREDFNGIALDGNWKESKHKIFRIFGNLPWAALIPSKIIIDMPDEWEETNDFDRTYDEMTGRWTFQCSMRDSSRFLIFFSFLPEFIESIEYLEEYYENWDYSRKYELIDDEVVCINREFIEYI